MAILSWQLLLVNRTTPSTPPTCSTIRAFTRKGYRTDWLSITFGPSLFIANAAGYGHDTVANGPAGNFSSVNTGGFTAPAKTDFLQFLDGTGEERDLFVVLAPGDITVKVANIPVKLYWDFAYNFDGGKR